jgi:hypothetical protein
MSGTFPEKSPLARLVLFMVCLSIAGSFAAGLHYFAVDLPQQKSVQAPENGNSVSTIEKCNSCKDYCTWLPTEKLVWECRGNCELIC